MLEHRAHRVHEERRDRGGGDDRGVVAVPLARGSSRRSRQMITHAPCPGGSGADRRDPGGSLLAPRGCELRAGSTVRSQPTLERKARHMTAQQSGDVKVLFLAGKGRSGGTLLASLLGQLPGFFNIGELNRLWDWGLVSNFRCGCGLPVQECPTWHAILEAGRRAARRARGIAPLYGGADRPRAGVGRAVAEHAAAVARDPGEQAQLGGARPLHGRVLGGLPEPSPTSPARASSSTRRDCRSSRSRSASFPASTCAIAQVDPRSARRRLLVEAIEDHDRPRHRRVHAEVQRVVLDHELAGAQPRRRGHRPARPGRGRAVRRDGTRSRPPCCASSPSSSASPPARWSSSRRRPRRSPRRTRSAATRCA